MNSRGVLKQLLDAIDASTLLDETSIDEYLKERNLDNGRILDFVKLKIADAKKELMRENVRNLKSQILQILEMTKGQFDNKSKTDLKELLENTMGQQTAAAFFHRLTTLEDKDMKVLMEELQALQILQDQKSDNNKK